MPSRPYLPRRLALADRAMRRRRAEEDQVIDRRRSASGRRASFRIARLAGARRTKSRSAFHGLPSRRVPVGVVDDAVGRMLADAGSLTTCHLATRPTTTMFVTKEARNRAKTELRLAGHPGEGAVRRRAQPHPGGHLLVPSSPSRRCRLLGRAAAACVVTHRRWSAGFAPLRRDDRLDLSLRFRDPRRLRLRLLAEGRPSRYEPELPSMSRRRSTRLRLPSAPR